MKFTILSIALFLLCACTMFNAKQTATAPMMPPRPLAIQIGKNWQVIEEAPKLSDERGRLPFQTEQSVQPEGNKSVSPADNRKLETPR
jgi:outer membrane biogenesis lipoprotein LolB